LTGPVLAARALPRVAAVALLAAGLAGCNREARADGTKFCESLRTEQITLTAGVSTPEQAAALVQRYRELQLLAPAAIRDEWTVVADLLEAAATAPTDDPTATQRLTEQALAAQQDVDTVTQWVRTVCGVDLRPGLPVDTPDPPAITPAPPPSG
jgi:hypothetical protein